MGCKIQVVERDDVIGADHKVEVIPKTERMQ
jgi:hypothetical protein